MTGAGLDYIVEVIDYVAKKHGWSKLSARAWEDPQGAYFLAVEKDEEGFAVIHEGMFHAHKYERLRSVKEVVQLVRCLI